MSRVLSRYHTDPSGTYVKYQCMAIGSGSEGAQTALQENYKPDMSLKDAEVLALSTLKQVMEEKVCASHVVRDSAAELNCVLVLCTLAIVHDGQHVASLMLYELVQTYIIFNTLC